MKHHVTAIAALLASATQVGAVGLDRSNQDITVLFEDGNYAELSFGQVTTNVSGTDNATGADYGDVAADFTQFGAAVKFDINDRLSFGLIFDQPFGVDVAYPTGATLPLLGGTAAYVETQALTALARYRLNENFSVHAGVRRQTLSGEVTLAGGAYGGLDGYNVTFGDHTATGYVAGVAYERPDIALRVALTYNSAMTHELPSTETLNGVPIAALPPTATGGLDGIGLTSVETPEAWNLDFQTGIAADTLLFGQIRHAKYSGTLVSPEFFSLATGGDSLTNIEDATAYSIGIGRRLTDNFSASVALGYESEENPLVSPLSPTNGLYSVQLGGRYTMDNVVFQGGVRYTWLGDAQPETGTPDTARANFTDNTALAVGLSIGFTF